MKEEMIANKAKRDWIPLNVFDYVWFSRYRNLSDMNTAPRALGILAAVKSLDICHPIEEDPEYRRRRKKVKIEKPLKPRGKDDI